MGTHGFMEEKQTNQKGKKENRQAQPNYQYRHQRSLIFNRFCQSRRGSLNNSSGTTYSWSATPFLQKMIRMPATNRLQIEARYTSGKTWVAIRVILRRPKNCYLNRKNGELFLHLRKVDSGLDSKSMETMMVGIW